MISPILTYNSEVWGTFVKSDLNSCGDNPPIEKAHLQYCKRYLEVHNKASNRPSRAKLGKYSMIIDINKKILPDAGQFNSETIPIYKYQLSFTAVVEIVSIQI